MSDRRAYRRIFWIGFAVLLGSGMGGCAEVARVLPGSTWHDKCGWKAEDCFGDPEYRRKTDAEIAARKAREARERKDAEREAARRE